MRGVVADRWLALAAYTAVIYGFLPFGPRLGVALARTDAGAWLLGPGIILSTLAGGVVFAAALVRRRAPLRAYAFLTGAVVSYALAFSWLRSQHLERTHLPEYGVAACLAWRAVAPLLPTASQGYVAAAVLATAIGYGDELLQRIVPGRVYDLRDVAMNGVGAVLGTVLIAAASARAGDGGKPLHDAARDAEALNRPSFLP